MRRWQIDTTIKEEKVNIQATFPYILHWSYEPERQMRAYRIKIKEGDAK
ncbi:MAG: hypothetical protein ACPL7E_09000 [bacterium]